MQNKPQRQEVIYWLSHSWGSEAVLKMTDEELVKWYDRAFPPDLNDRDPLTAEDLVEEIPYE